MSEALIDHETLAALEELMGADYSMLLNIFQVDTRERISRLRLACGERNRSDLHLAAHSLKGSSSNMGAAQLTELCRQLEFGAEQLPFAELQALLTQVEGQFALICQVLEAELERVKR